MPADDNIAIRGTLKFEGMPEESCISTVQDLLNFLAAHSILEVPSSITNVIISNTQPFDTQRDALWIRTNNAGAVLGFYLYDNGSWRQYLPVPGQLVRVGLPYTVDNPPFGYQVLGAGMGYTAPQVAAIQATWVVDPADPTKFLTFDVLAQV